MENNQKKENVHFNKFEIKSYTEKMDEMFEGEKLTTVLGAISSKLVTVLSKIKEKKLRKKTTQYILQSIIETLEDFEENEMKL